ncbi:YncE family protein [Spirosoma aerophilum]
MKRTLLFLLPALLVGSLMAQTPPTYRVLSKTPLGGTGFWDYVTVDPDARRVYITHNNQIEVVDADTKKRVGVIPNMSGAHGVAIATKQNRGFITNGRNNTVMMFDPKTLKTLGDVPAGTNPDALLYDAFSGRVFIFNNDSRDITVLEAATGKPLSTFSIGGNPEAGVTDGKGRIFVNVEDTSEIVVFDAKTLKELHRYPLTPGEEPTGIAFDAVNHRLFSACRKNQTMVVLDSETGKRVAQLPIGQGTDGAAFDPKTNRAFSSNGDGTLTVVQAISPTSFRVLENAPTERGARTLAFDAKTGHLFTVTAQFGPAPAPTAENPNPRPSILPDTFVLLELGQ